MYLAILTGPSHSVKNGTVSLVPLVDYLVSNEALDGLGVCMHSGLKVLICYSCRVALTSGMVTEHRNTHHYLDQVCQFHARLILV